MATIIVAIHIEPDIAPIITNQGSLILATPHKVWITLNQGRHTLVTVTNLDHHCSTSPLHSHIEDFTLIYRSLAIGASNKAIMPIHA